MVFLIDFVDNFGVDNLNCLLTYAIQVTINQLYVIVFKLTSKC